MGYGVGGGGGGGLGWGTHVRDHKLKGGRRALVTWAASELWLGRIHANQCTTSLGGREARKNDNGGTRERLRANARGP